MEYTNALKIISLLLISINISACNTLSTNDDIKRQMSQDPFQNVNRKIYSFNNGVDKAILKPVATRYKKYVPSVARKGVNNFFGNIGEPLDALNNLLQGKYHRALQSTYRFTVNSTVGLAGLVDVAKKHDVQPVSEDFGQTLGAWGVKPGPYIMLPLLGPTNFRDGIGIITDRFIYSPNDIITDSSLESLSLTIIDVVDIRSNLIGLDNLLDQQIDPYTFLRLGYESDRINSLYDGNPPSTEEEFDF